MLRSAGGILAPRHDDVHWEPDQLGREGGKALELALGIAGLDDEVLALDVAKITQPLPEGLPP